MSEVPITPILYNDDNDNNNDNDDNDNDDNSDENNNNDTTLSTILFRFDPMMTNFETLALGLGSL